MPARSLEEAAFRPTEVARLERMAEDAERAVEQWNRAGAVLTVGTAFCAAVYLGTCVLTVLGSTRGFPLFSVFQVGSLTAAVVGSFLRTLIGPPQARRGLRRALRCRQEAARLREEHAVLQKGLPGRAAAMVEGART